MTSRVLLSAIALLTLVARPVLAQARLPLAEAVGRARAQSPEARASLAAENEAAERVTQARAGHWPRVDFAETWQRGDQPVFVFSSLLSQRRFTADNFQIDRLNHPDPVNNWRSALMVQQLVFDGGGVRADVRSASLGKEIASAARRQAGNSLAVAATDAYGTVLRVASQTRAAAAAVESARRDLEVARNRRAAGVVTDADVLALEVHVASMRAQHISAEAEERVARTRLNQVMGAALDAYFELDENPSIVIDTSDATALEGEALAARPEITMAKAKEGLAEASHLAARSAFLPQVAAQGGYEWNGSRIDNQVSSWIVGAEVRVSLFHGFADKSRVAEADHSRIRSAAEREQAENAVRLDVRAAIARLDAARAREQVGRASVAQATESQRIIRDRYEAGMASVSDLLRAAETVLAAESQATTARVDVLIQAAQLERALGR